MGQKALLKNIEASFEKEIVIDRASQTLSPTKSEVSYLSRTEIHRKKPQKFSNKHRENTTQTDKNDLKLRSNAIIHQKNRSFFFNCSRKTQKKWLILQNQEYFEEFEPLAEILRREKPMKIPNSTKEIEPLIFLSEIEEKPEQKLPKFLEENLGFAELSHLFPNKSTNLSENSLNIEEFELIEPLTEGKNEEIPLKSRFSHSFKGFYQKRFLEINIVEFDRIIAKNLAFEEKLIKELLLEDFLYEILSDISDESYCSQFFSFIETPRKISPQNEKSMKIVKIRDFGRCSLFSLLLQRRKKGSFLSYFLCFCDKIQSL